MVEPSVIELSPRSKEVTVLLLDRATTVGVGPVVDCKGHHYKGIQVVDAGSVAGETVDIEISNDGTTWSPASTAAAVAMVKKKWAQVDDACTYVRANLKTITGGKVSVIMHGILES